jgi:hypothetical protein
MSHVFPYNSTLPYRQPCRFCFSLIPGFCCSDRLHASAMAVIRSTLTVTIAFPVWNDSCVNSSTIVLSSRYYFLYASCPVWVVLPTEYHFCYTSGILLLFYLNFWTICPKAAFLFFVHERTKRAFMLLHINALTLFYYKIILAVVPYKLEFTVLPSFPSSAP